MVLIRNPGPVTISLDTLGEPDQFATPSGIRVRVSFKPGSKGRFGAAIAFWVVPNAINGRDECTLLADSTRTQANLRSAKPVMLAKRQEPAH